MKLYKIVGEEKIELTPDISLFEAVNIHGGDEQEVLLSIEKDTETSIKNLLCQLSIVDNDEVYNLKKNDTEDNSVYFYRTLTGKIMKFRMYIKRDNDYIILKPDKEGLLYIEKNWTLNEAIELKLELECEEYFSKTFGEKKTIMLDINFLGDPNEEKTFI